MKRSKKYENITKSYFDKGGVANKIRNKKCRKTTDTRTKYLPMNGKL